MNIEKIKYYIDLVECQNFTETAKKNFVSQTTISQQIASLENEFDLKFIDRKQIPIKPTEAGLLFYNEASIIWKQYQAMKEKMTSFKNNKKTLLKIEYSTMTDIKSLMDIIPLFKKKNFNSEIVLEKVLLKNVAELLMNNVYDLAVTFESEFKHILEIETIPVYTGYYHAAIGENHPLYNRNELTLNSLYQYPLIMLSPSAIGKSYNLMIEKAKKDGYTPIIEKVVSDIETELLLIRLENLIGFFPDNYSLKDTSEGIRLLPIKNNHHSFKIVVAYSKKNQNNDILSFINSIKNSIII